MSDSSSPGISFIEFSKSILRTKSSQDVRFKFSSEDDGDEDPLLAHGCIITYYSPVFKRLMRENFMNRDDDHKVIIPIIDVDKQTFKDFVEGIYLEFSEEESQSKATLEIFELSRKFQLPSKLSRNILAAIRDPLPLQYLSRGCVNAALDAHTDAGRDAGRDAASGANRMHKIQSLKIPLQLKRFLLEASQDADMSDAIPATLIDFTISLLKKPQGVKEADVLESHRLDDAEAGRASGDVDGAVAGSSSSGGGPEDGGGGTLSDDSS